MHYTEALQWDHLYFILTIPIFLRLAVFLAIPLITGAGRVQTPVQDVSQQHLLLIEQLCCGRGHQATSVGLCAIITSPVDRDSGRVEGLQWVTGASRRWHKEKHRLDGSPRLFVMARGPRELPHEQEKWHRNSGHFSTDEFRLMTEALLRFLTAQITDSSMVIYCSFFLFLEYCSFLNITYGFPVELWKEIKLSFKTTHLQKISSGFINCMFQKKKYSSSAHPEWWRDVYFYVCTEITFVEYKLPSYKPAKQFMIVWQQLLGIL